MSLEDSTNASSAELRQRIQALEEENRQLRELAALDSAREWQTTFDSVGDAIWLMDADCRIKRCNRAAQELFGKEVHDIIGHHCYEVAHGTSTPIQECPVRSLCQSRHRESTDLALNGRWYRVTVDPILNSSGALSGLVHIMEDITTRKEAELALRESEARLRQADAERERHLVQLEAVFDHLSEGLVIADPEGRMVHWNPVAVKIHGFASEEVWRRRLAELESVFELATLDGTVLPLERWPLARILRGETIRNLEVQIRRRDRGDWRHFFSYGGALAPGKDGKPLLAVMTITDITERKEAADALRRSAGRLRQGVRVARLGLFEHDHRTNEIYYSPVFREISGWHPDGPITLAQTIESVAPEDRPGFIAAIQRSHDPSGDGLFTSEHRIVRPDGTVRWVSTRAQTTFEGEGPARRPIRTVGALIDITERKQAETSLRNVLRNARTITMHAKVTAPPGWDQHPPEWSAPHFQWVSRFDDEQSCQEVLPLKLEPGEDYANGWGRAKLQEDWEPMSMVAARAFVSGATNWRQEFRALDRHGRLHWFTQAASIEPISHGCWRVTTINTDTTERKQAEDALRQSRNELEQRVSKRTAELARINEQLTNEIAERIQAEQSLRRQATLLNMTSDAIIIHDLDGTIRYWNRGAERLYGYSFEEANGRITHELLATSFPKGVEALEIALLEHEGFQGELTHTTKAGRKVIVESHHQLVKQPDGTFVVLETNHDITERVSLHDEIVAASERERERIGQNLHDGLCQILTAARLKADSIVTRLAGQEPLKPANVRPLSSLLLHAVDEARALARGLEPVEHLPEGLMAALQQLASSTSRLFSVACACEFPQAVFVQDHQVATELFRIAQEAVNNAIKHSRASSIRIRLGRDADCGILTITSDGKPFPKRPRTSGMGLRTMHFRARRIGATLEITQGSRKGTIVRCVLPPALDIAPHPKTADPGNNHTDTRPKPSPPGARPSKPDEPEKGASS